MIEYIETFLLNFLCQEKVHLNIFRKSIDFIS